MKIAAIMKAMFVTSALLVGVVSASAFDWLGQSGPSCESEEVKKTVISLLDCDIMFKCKVYGFTSLDELPQSDEDLHRVVKEVLKKNTQNSPALSVRDPFGRNPSEVLAKFVEGSATSVVKVIHHLRELNLEISVVLTDGYDESVKKHYCTAQITFNEEHMKQGLFIGSMINAGIPVSGTDDPLIEGVAGTTTGLAISQTIQTYNLVRSPISVPYSVQETSQGTYVQIIGETKDILRTNWGM